MGDTIEEMVKEGIRSKHNVGFREPLLEEDLIFVVLSGEMFKLIEQ